MGRSRRSRRVRNSRDCPRGRGRLWRGSPDERTVRSRVVSGRALEDIHDRVGIDGLIYAGNHGLEISGGGLRFDETTAVARKHDIEILVCVLAVRLRHIAGVHVETKGLTASVHYRRVHPADWGEVERVVRATIPDDHPNFLVTAGQMVWEVRPRVDWNKGTAVRWIREQLGLREAVTFYLGDDRTDEDAFAEVGRFVTARVGNPRPTRAGYRIADTEEVAEFLLWLSRSIRFADPPEASGTACHTHPVTRPGLAGVGVSRP